MSLTKSLNNRVLNHIGLSPDGNTNYKVCYDGFIHKSMACYDKIIEYHVAQTGNDSLDLVLRLSTPLYIKIHSDNNITYTLSLNDRSLCILGEVDLNSLFKSEIREFNIDYIFG
jgi:hypothetical protein